MSVSVSVCVCGGGGGYKFLGAISAQQLSYWGTFIKLTPVLHYSQCVLREIIQHKLNWKPYVLAALSMFNVTLYQQVLGTARLHFLTRCPQALENLIILVIFCPRLNLF